MRVHTKIVIEPDGSVSEDEWHEHDGPVAEAKGGGSSTTVVNTPPPTEQELKLQEKQLELATFQLDELRKQSSFQEDQAEILLPLLEAQAKEAVDAAARREELRPIEDELLQLQLEEIRRGSGASPEEIKLIEETTGAALSAGESDISRFRDESLERLSDELANALGLRPGDSPIVDRGQRVAQEATRQQGQLVSSLRAAESNAKLNFPLARDQVFAAINQNQQQLTSARDSFQAQLQQQAFANRLGATGQQQGFGLGLATGVPFNVNQAVQGLQQVRLGSASQSTNSSKSLGFSDITSGLGGIGGFLSGARAVGLFSSKEFKEGFDGVDEAAMLDAVAGTDVSMWSYKGEDERHVGPMAEDFKEAFGLGDGVTIPVVDAFGVLFAAIKGLNQKIEAMTHG